MNWLTPKQVAEQLQVTRNKVYDLLRDGLIPHVKVGDLYRIPENYSDNMLTVNAKPKLRIAR
jgi:excisionase family DNA binding protein